MEEDESEIGEAATTEHPEGAVEVEDESEIDEAATTEHPQGTVEVEEEEQSQIDEARKTDYRKPVNENAQPLAKLPEKRKRSCLCLATDSQISAVMKPRKRTLPFQEALVFSPQSHVVISTSIPRSSWVSIRSYEAVVEQLRNLYMYAVDPRLPLGGSWVCLTKLYANDWSGNCTNGYRMSYTATGNTIPIRNHIKTWEECLKFSMEPKSTSIFKILSPKRRTRLIHPLDPIPLLTTYEIRTFHITYSCQIKPCVYIYIYQLHSYMAEPQLSHCFNYQLAYNS
ncbi:hypothetical protein DVH24_028690 [Malus domestica]|uniref:Uncharacterized protein n=1 Tax=Malus domestica TaxID=3750 RepID=A0A498IVG2_MALDO|nr:hypothetical protein DVH24_028690 [Malus domestica]